MNLYLSDFPQLVSQLRPGQEIIPTKVKAGSNRRVIWVCASGHEWETAIAQRTRSLTGCPVCRNQKLVSGYNDLEALHPNIAATWHPTKNEGLRPSEVLAGSRQKCWWLCPDGHDYQSSVSSRTAKGTGCPVCSGNEVRAGINDLQTRFPLLAVEWDTSKNGNLQANQVSPGSPQTRWWLCSKFGHSYQTSPAKRTGKENAGCPFCSHQRVLPGFNDLASLKPDLARQWDYDLNFPRVPEEQPINVALPVWWKCPNGAHPSWLSRTRKSAECPICMNQVLLPGFNDLATVNPALAREWHPTLNMDSSPSTTLSGSRRKVWWLCRLGHSWQATLDSRKRSGCPFCANRRVWPGFNDLATVSPDLAADWDYVLNGELTPASILPSTAEKVWWKCTSGDNHESFSQSPNDRSKLRADNKRTGCPVCANRKVVKGINHLSDTHPELWKQLDLNSITTSDASGLLAGSKLKVNWKCDQGHSWMAPVYSRTSGETGCPQCARYGFKPDSPAIVYFIAHYELQAAKIGITNADNSFDRVDGFVRNFGWRKVATWRVPGSLARTVESLAFSWIREDLGLGQKLTAKDMGRQGGETETFDLSSVNEYEVVSKIAEIIERFTPGGS